MQLIENGVIYIKKNTQNTLAFAEVQKQHAFVLKAVSTVFCAAFDL